jgi:hypothetical protein
VNAGAPPPLPPRDRRSGIPDLLSPRVAGVLAPRTERPPNTSAADRKNDRRTKLDALATSDRTAPMTSSNEENRSREPQSAAASSPTRLDQAHVSSKAEGTDARSTLPDKIGGRDAADIIGCGYPGSFNRLRRNLQRAVNIGAGEKVFRLPELGGVKYPGMEWAYSRAACEAFVRKFRDGLRREGRTDE